MKYNPIKQAIVSQACIVPSFIITLLIASLVLSGCSVPGFGDSDDEKTATQQSDSATNNYGSQSDSKTDTSTPSSNEPMASTDQASAPVSGEQIAIITTNKGVVKLKFFPKQAPETVKNFVELSKKGFYDGLTFHRVIPGFMIQGGDPLGNGTGGETYKGPNTLLKGEVSKDLHHIHGAVAMANRADPNTASSQFYIVQNKDGTPFLDGGYTIFAQAYEGLNIVDLIANVERDNRDKPLKPVKIEKVEIATQK